jgi:hypothetical protein
MTGKCPMDGYSYPRPYTYRKLPASKNYHPETMDDRRVYCDRPLGGESEVQL